MNIINVAKFFDCMARGDIAFSVDDVMTDFETHFGVKNALPPCAEHHEATKHREGTYLAVYVTSDSLDEDVLIDALRMHMKSLTWWLFESPYGENEVVYIVKLDDNDDEN